MMNFSLMLNNFISQAKEKVENILQFVKSQVGEDKQKLKLLTKWGLFIFGVSCLLFTDFFGWVMDSGLIAIGSVCIFLAVNYDKLPEPEQGVGMANDEDIEYLRKDIINLLQQAATDGEFTIDLDNELDLDFANNTEDFEE